MTYKDVMQELQALGTEETRKTYRRHGAQGEVYGVSYAGYAALKKRIKIEHDLAMRLWTSGNYDARIVATMIADPEQGIPLLDKWAADLNSYPIVDAVATFASQTTIDIRKVEKWMQNKDEWVGALGWSVLARLARMDGRLSDETLEIYLDIIERGIHKEKNRVRHSMNSALIAIGVRNDKLQKKALAAAYRIGRVEVDHGDTECKTPDAAQYILKTSGRSLKRKAVTAG